MCAHLLGLRQQLILPNAGSSLPSLFFSHSSLCPCRQGTDLGEARGPLRANRAEWWQSPPPSPKAPLRLPLHREGETRPPSFHQKTRVTPEEGQPRLPSCLHMHTCVLGHTQRTVKARAEVSALVGYPADVVSGTEFTK